MTSELSVEGIVEEQFFFHCSCGATFETSSTRVTCGDCGETVEVVRCVPTATGKKYKLRISRQRRGWTRELALWPPVFTSGTALPAHRPHLELDHNWLRSNITRPPTAPRSARLQRTLLALGFVDPAGTSLGSAFVVGRERGLCTCHNPAARRTDRRVKANRLWLVPRLSLRAAAARREGLHCRHMGARERLVETRPEVGISSGTPAIFLPESISHSRLFHS